MVRQEGRERQDNNARLLTWLLAAALTGAVQAADVTPVPEQYSSRSGLSVGEEPREKPDKDADDDGYELDPKVPPWGRYTIERLMPAYDNISRWVDNTARNIDNFFGTEESYRVHNDSYLRISQEFSWEESDGFSQDLGFRFRLDMPTATERLRVIFESDPEESEGTLEEQGPGTVRRTQPERSRSVLGLGRFLGRDKRQRWDANVNAGVRLRFPLNPYVRFTTERLWSLSDGPWMLESNNRVSWFNDDGYFARSRWDVGRPFSQRDHLRFITTFQWREKEDELEFYEAAEWNRILGPRSVVRYAGVAVGRSSRMRAEDFYLLADYRRNIHRETLFLDLVPELHFPREANFDPRWMMTVRLELYFRGQLIQRHGRASSVYEKPNESPWRQAALAKERARP